MKIYIMTLTGKKVSLEVDPQINTEQLKELIEQTEGIPPKQQRLVLRGKNMDDEQTLREYGVVDDTTIYVVIQLR